MSSLGRIQGARNTGGRYFPRAASDGYCSVIVGSHKAIKVHRIVHILFNDPELSSWTKNATVDHIDRTRENNASINLRWATRSDQRQNQRDRCIGDRKRSNVDLPGEVWGVARGVNVSNMGRIHFVRKDTKHYPKVQRNGYCRVQHGGKHTNVHILVMEAGGVKMPSVKHTVDHINHDRSDNRLSNLRWATRSEQRLNQGTRLDIRGRAVLGREVGTIPWIEFEDCKDASKSTGASLIAVRQVANPNSGCTGSAGKGDVRFEFRFKELEDLPNESWKTIVAFEWLEGRYSGV